MEGCSWARNDKRCFLNPWFLDWTLQSPAVPHCNNPELIIGKVLGGRYGQVDSRNTFTHPTALITKITFSERASVARDLNCDGSAGQAEQGGQILASTPPNDSHRLFVESLNMVRQKTRETEK
jgi:hypothetical protein